MKGDLRHENCDAMTGAVLHQLSYPQLKDVFHISNIDLHLQRAGTAEPGGAGGGGIEPPSFKQKKLNNESSIFKISKFSRGGFPQTSR